MNGIRLTTLVVLLFALAMKLLSGCALLEGIHQTNTHTPPSLHMTNWPGDKP